MSDRRGKQPATARTNTRRDSLASAPNGNDNRRSVFAALVQGYNELSARFEELGCPLPPAPNSIKGMLISKAKRAMKPSLTPQQHRLVEHLAAGMSITDAAIAAGYSDSSRMTAGQCGSQALEAIRRKMPEVLAQHGLTDDVLVEKYLRPLLDATETKFFQKDGEVVETREVAALGTRTTALDMAFKLAGSYPAREVGYITGENIQVNFVPPACRVSQLPEDQANGIDGAPSAQPKRLIDSAALTVKKSNSGS